MSEKKGINEKVHDIETRVSVHEEVCAERYAHLKRTLERIEGKQEDHKNVIFRIKQDLSNGKMAVRVLMGLGGLVGVLKIFDWLSKH